MPLTSESVNKHFEENKTFCVMIYGAQGTGKTILTSSAQGHPNLANLAYVDSDPGLVSIVGERAVNISRVDFSGMKDLKDMPAFLKRTLPEVKTVVFDTASALVSVALDELQGDSEVQDFRHYRTLTGRVEKIVHNLRGAGYSVILTAGVKDDEVDQKLKTRRPDLPPSLGKRVAHFVDHIWHTYLSPDGSYNLLFLPMYFASGAEVVAKTRNEKFVQSLKAIQRPNVQHVIQIGKIGDDIEKYPNLNTFYNLYLEAIESE